jgi:enoyl-CoA hydratase/carnithine racemase
MNEVIVDTRDGICRIELARPDKKNALTQRMYDLLAEAVTGAEVDRQVRAVLIHGAPDCFTAGNDLHDFLADPQLGDDAPAVRFLHALANADKPLVAAVAGPAVGIGTTMLLHCDFVYATAEARLQMPFVALGLVPEAGSSLLLPRAVGHLRAAELLMLGRAVDGRRAFELGLVTAVVPQDELLATAGATAASLAALPAEAMRQTKRLLKGSGRAELIGRIREELQLFGERLESAETKAAIARFFARARPESRPA